MTTESDILRNRVMQALIESSIDLGSGHGDDTVLSGRVGTVADAVLAVLGNAETERDQALARIRNARTEISHQQADWAKRHPSYVRALGDVDAHLTGTAMTWDAFKGGSEDGPSDD